MSRLKTIGKREFIQHTSKYLKLVEESDQELVITYHRHPELVLSKIKKLQFKDLQGTISIKIKGDINESVLSGYEEWFS